MSLIESQRPDRTPPGPLDLVIDLHPDDVDAPAFVPVHLRDPEDVPVDPPERDEEAVPAETAVTETTAEPNEVPPAAADSPPSAESPPTKEPDRPSKNRRKKNRRRRRRKPSHSESQAGRDATGPTAATDGPSSSGDSFGAGLDP